MVLLVVLFGVFSVSQFRRGSGFWLGSSVLREGFGAEDLEKVGRHEGGLGCRLQGFLGFRNLHGYPRLHVRVGHDSTTRGATLLGQQYKGTYKLRVDAYNPS